MLMKFGLAYLSVLLSLGKDKCKIMSAGGLGEGFQRLKNNPDEII